MTPEAKRALSATIRSLRERMLHDLRASVEGAYRLSVRPKDAGLDETAGIRRRRLEAWADEQVRAAGGEGNGRDRDAFFREAEKQAAYTLLNRLAILRLLEASGLRPAKVASRGWESPDYKHFRELAPALVRDATEGYTFLLELVFQELALDLPGLYGPVGVVDLVPVPAATLRHVVEALAAPELESCWTDDMTLGWIYQYWNDPDREALDAKLNAGGKVEPHEIASKTQMFTERYMVDWLLQNSLGPMWLATCRRHGWVPEAEADGTLLRLEERRAEWRRRREGGEVPPTELMPLHSEAERRWAYYVPQPIPDDAVAQAPESVRDLRILDPAVGSGHFLVVALDLLVALYHEEARHRGTAGAEEWSDRAIVERILEHNLHGIDLDPRAVQIAAAALWLKARQVCRDAHPSRLNLVSSDLRLSSLADDDPALAELRREVEAETGIPGELTDTLVHALKGADHLGSLLKVDAAVEDALRRHEAAQARAGAPDQTGLWDGPAPSGQAARIEEARASVLARLEQFLSHHSGGDDLGLRLRGEQLAAGVRFVRMVREGTYDLVVGNPPYQGTSKMRDAAYVQRHYARGKADLYAAFLERGLALVRLGGYSALLTMRNWMFTKQYADLRTHLLEGFDLRAIADLTDGAFEEVGGIVVSVVVSVFRRSGPVAANSIAIQPTALDERNSSAERTPRKRAAVLVQRGRHKFDTKVLATIPEAPILYWWSRSEVESFASTPKISDYGGVREGLGTRDDTRFLRRPWEIVPTGFAAYTHMEDRDPNSDPWTPFIKGSAGKKWIEPLDFVVRWQWRGCELAHFARSRFGRGASYYFGRGIAVATIGHDFSARLHRFKSVFGDTGVSVFGRRTDELLCAMNSSSGIRVLEALNPSVHFKVNDINRMPIAAIPDANGIVAVLEVAFTESEKGRENSIEFMSPSPSSWRYTQAWAQTAVDRPTGTPLPSYEPEYDPEPPTDHLSFALGVGLGRFGPSGEGILDPAEGDLSHALSAGILFLDGTLALSDDRDSLGHPAAAPLHRAWDEHGAAIGTKRAGLRDWLRLDFFGDVHRKMYENRPIHWPLSSANRTFVAWINIHRWTGQTLRILLADHLHPALVRIEGELSDVRDAMRSPDAKAARAAERRYEKVFRAREELAAFIGAVEQCADRGAPPAGPGCPEREVDAAYVPDLDDSVMINSAALWPLLDPQWKDPRNWWKELATAKGRKDYDWAKLAMRYWPARVDAKCRTDPSLGVAHGCFWRYHPERAWAWELRLQDEIGPGFRIEVAPYRGDGGDAAHRAAWLREHPERALAAVEREAVRRMGRGTRRQIVPRMEILEPGLWTEVPERCWEMELRLIEKQGDEFRLGAPDEPGARAALEAAHPEWVQQRADLVARVALDAGLFRHGDEEEEREADELEAAEDEDA